VSGPRSPFHNVVIFEQPALLEFAIVASRSWASARRLCFRVGSDTDLSQWLIEKIDLAKINLRRRYTL
jgi:hypothetical protein